MPEVPRKDSASNATASAATGGGACGARPAVPPRGNRCRKPAAKAPASAAGAGPWCRPPRLRRGQPRQLRTSAAAAATPAPAPPVACRTSSAAAQDLSTRFRTRSGMRRPPARAAARPGGRPSLGAFETKCRGLSDLLQRGPFPAPPAAEPTRRRGRARAGAGRRRRRLRARRPAGPRARHLARHWAAAAVPSGRRRPQLGAAGGGGRGGRRRGAAAGRCVPQRLRRAMV